MASLRSDAEVRQKVIEALARAAGIDAQRIQVDVVGQVVTLRGLVPSAAAKRAATDLARQVSGVIDVRNELAIAAGSPTNRTDSEIAREVQADLARNLRFQPTRIQVEVHGGTVYLSGFVGSLEQKWLADEVAWWTAGVRDVVNDLKVT